MVPIVKLKILWIFVNTRNKKFTDMSMNSNKSVARIDDHGADIIVRQYPERWYAHNSLQNINEVIFLFPKAVVTL